MTTDQHLNTGSMALGALPPDEAAAFTEHLDTCPTCSAELTSFLETAAILGSSVAQTPPAGLRRSVLQAIANTPQLPPLTAPVETADPVPDRHLSAVGPSTGDDVLPQSPLATVLALRRPWYRRPQALLAAAVAAVVLGGGVTAIVATRPPAAQTATECVTAAADKSVLTPTVGGKGDVTLSPACNAVVINMPALPAAPAGKVYEVWVIKGKAASSVKVLNANAGNTTSEFSTSVHAGDSAIGVTLEPSPGSPKPTANPFWLVPLTS